MSNLNFMPLDAIGDRIAFGVKRHQVLAGNVANAQTPGYKAKDVLAMGGFAAELAVTSSGHIRSSQSVVNAVVQRDQSSLSSLDGNNVDLDQERGLLVQNALTLEAQMRFATHYIRQMQTAAS